MKILRDIKHTPQFKKKASWVIFTLICFSFPTISGILPKSLTFTNDNNIYSDETQQHVRSRRSTVDTSIIIPSNYSVHELPPTSNGGTVGVKLSIVIMNVRDIKEISEEITIEMNLRMYWKDSRLSHLVEHLATSSSTKSPEAEFVLLQPSILPHIWHPDLYIDRVKKIDQPHLISEPASLRMYPDNTLRYSARVSLTLACAMDFHYFPADTQKCNCDFKSYAYSDKKMNLKWRDENGATFANSGLNLSNYFVGLENPDTFSVQTQSGTWSGLRFTVLLTRKLSYHIIQTYLPSIVLVIVSWLSFLVNPDSVPGRMTVLMTCLLTLISMFAAVRNSTPNVSYVKSVDVWMFVCVFFVFLALMEFTLVLKIKSMKFKSKSEKIVKAGNGQGGGGGVNNIESARSQRSSIVNPNTLHQNTLPIRRVPSFRGHQLHLFQTVDGDETEMHHIPSRRASTEYMEYPGASSRRASIGPTTLPPEPIFYSRPPSHYQVLPQFFPISEASLRLPPVPPDPTPVVSINDKIVLKVEVTASVIIPILFLIFNILYWPFLIVTSEYYTQETNASIF